jgi:glycosyltransferase involved in cell wall biosynthesis
MQIPIDIYFYPSYTGPNPYIRLLGESIKRINPQAAIYYYELDRFRFHSDKNRRSICHIHFVQRFFQINIGKNFISRNTPNLGLIKQFLFFEKLKRNFGLKFIWTLHNSSSFRTQPWWASFLSKYLAYRITDSFIIHCKQTLEDPIIKRSKKPIFVIPPGNFIGCFGKIIENRKEAKTALKFPQGIPTFLLFGELHPGKNLKEILPNLAKIPQKNILFVIAGKPIDPYVYHISKDFSNDNRFLFILRTIPNEQIRYLMATSDFLINAQTKGYVSGVTMLALSYGLPVISINYGCAPMFIKDGINGFLFQETNSIKDSINRALNIFNNPTQYNKMRLMAIESVRRFSWKNVAEKTLEAYYKILNLQDKSGLY